MGGVFVFYRETGSAQGVVFQSTGVQLRPFSPIRASFQLRNTSAVRKRISVLIHDRDFSDLSVCTFWLDPASPIRTYSMRTHTTRMWSNTTISFYAATADGLPSYGLDEVSLDYDPSLPDAGTECVDPTALIGVGVPGPNLLVNGDFSAGLAPWGTFGQIVSQVSSVGVFEFYRPPGTPAGVVFQDTGLAMTDKHEADGQLQPGQQQQRAQARDGARARQRFQRFERLHVLAAAAAAAHDVFDADVRDEGLVAGDGVGVRRHHRNRPVDPAR